MLMDVKIFGSIKRKNLKTKFINASSHQKYLLILKKLIYFLKRPISPYGKAKLASFNLTKLYRKEN